MKPMSEHHLNEMVEKLDATIKTADRKLVDYRQTTFARFPILFTLSGSFGVVATFYGFEKIIEGIPWLANHPLLILAVGIGVLVATGTLYKKLG